MPKSDPREEALFQAAAQLKMVERAPFLNGACRDDLALRQRLDALLAAHDAEDSLLAESGSRRLDEADRSGKPEHKRKSATIKLDLADAPDEAVGQTLGRYKLLERVGEGGCGVVYVAEQTEPVRRRVALKVIKLGMDTKQVVARFEAERQALAMMDHPNIAKVLDAGTIGASDSQLSTPNSQLPPGRPYFVMELVRGIRITDYCDQAQLSTKERLDLFIKVCQAIQHAHQKGIIHRDIKPSNILVTLHDGVPVPKVIDFGIAKATEGRLTDNTVYTQLHQFIGTPAYMSPEQAEMSGLDIDTRSDIYSLGVLLYELLAGSTPFDAKELMASGIDQMRKTIREKEPVRPSTKLATLQGEELKTTAKRRSVETSKLANLLRGDLDWIVMKCLEKDRTRRYETANGLAAELKRHLSNEPVVARPPSAAYKLQKSWQRNRLAYSAGLAVTAALVTGLGLSTWLFFKESRAYSTARAAEREQARLRAEAEKARAEEMERRVQTGAELNEMGVAFMSEGRLDVAERILRRAFALHRKLLGNENGNTVMAAGNLAILYIDQNRTNEAEAVFNELLPRDAEERPENFGLLSFRAQYRVQSGRLGEAAADMAKALALRGDDALAWLRYAAILLENQDMKGYDATRRQMLKRFLDATNLNVTATISKACLLAPGPVETIEAAGRLADSASELSPTDKWTTLAKALAEYRRGSYTNTVEWGRRALAATNASPPQQAAAVAVLTAAHLRAGQMEAALKCLDAWDVETWKSYAKFSPGNLFSEDWHNILVARILLREASAIFTSDVVQRCLRRNYRYQGGCFSELVVGSQTVWLEAKDDWSEVYTFTEFQRFGGVVELRDPRRNYHIRIPVEDGMSRLSMDGGATWRDLYALRKEPAKERVEIKRP